MDVGEPSVQSQSVHEEDQPQPVPQSVSQPVSIIRVGGSSSPGTRAGSGSRANEVSTVDDREVKRVRFTESQGQKRQGEDVEELAARAEEQHLDADVEVPAHKSWRIRIQCNRCSARTNEQLRAEQDNKCSRRSKKHSDHFAWLKISTMTRSWSCAYSRMS